MKRFTSEKDIKNDVHDYIKKLKEKYDHKPSDEDDYPFGGEYDKYKRKDALDSILEKLRDNKSLDDATVSDVLKKFGAEKILEAIGEDKIQDFIRRKKIKRIKDGM